MSRTAPLLFALLASCSHSPSGPAAVAAPPTDARQYYPLEAGWKWAYDVERGNERILAVYAVRSRDGDRAIVEAGPDALTYDVRPEGISRVTGLPEARKRQGEGDFLLRSPVAVGARWAIDEGSASVTAAGRTVTVPAGTFSNCVTIEEAREAPRRLVRTTYAPGVGPILVESLVQIPGAGAYETTLRATLRGVTRPGEDPTQ